jgi:hypothetical protein
MRSLVAAAAALLATTAAAEGYGTAGCGLGSLAFGTQPGFVQVLAATTNGTFYTQTFGITSGTSNCGQSLFALQGTRVFIEGNREALAKDAARGQGETIVALRNIAACRADAQALGAALQGRFEALFPASASPEQVRDGVIQLLQGDAALGCRIAG